MSTKLLSSETARAKLKFVTIAALRTSPGPDGELTVNGTDATSEGTAGAARRQQALDMELLTEGCSQHGAAHSAPLALRAVKTQTPALIWATNAAMARNFFMRQSALFDYGISSF